jgi:hypothetical protein
MSRLNLTETQIEMLRKGYRRAQEIPEGFYMGWWASASEIAPCGTVCCYAGEILIANGKYAPEGLLRMKKVERMPSIAEAFLGVPGGSLTDLFHANKWPTDLYDEYYGADTSAKEAAVLAQVVELFIQNDGDTSDWRG